MKINHWLYYDVSEEVFKELMLLVNGNLAIYIRDKKKQKLSITLICRNEKLAVTVENIINGKT